MNEKMLSFPFKISNVCIGWRSMQCISNSKVIEMVFLHYKETLSTNTTAKEWVAKSTPNQTTVIFAENQTQGRGQFGKSWLSAEGKSATFSVILHLKQPKAFPFLINLMASLSALDHLTKAIPHGYFQLKWPNDLYCNDRKAGGILVENTFTSRALNPCIVGYGINLLPIPSLQTKQPSTALFSAGQMPNTTALHLAYGISETVTERAHALNQAVENQEEERLFTHWKHRFEQFLFAKDVPRLFTYKGETICATILGIDEEGKLRLEHQDQSVKAYAHGEIQWVWQ